MSDPFIGEIRMVGFDYAPSGWALCNGQLLTIAQNSALFSLLGTRFGGDGRNTFGLPDLRARVPLHQGQGVGTGTYTIGQRGGAESVTLGTAQLPPHTHALAAHGGAGSSPSASGTFIATPSDPATGAALNAFSPTSDAAMNAQAIAASGGGQAHENMQPYLCVNFVIATTGIYPTRD
jgi:microcystin-dependent protein